MRKPVRTLQLRNAWALHGAVQNAEEFSPWILGERSSRGLTKAYVISPNKTRGGMRSAFNERNKKARPIRVFLNPEPGN
jgi:hypothetical protein